MVFAHGVNVAWSCSACKVKVKAEAAYLGDLCYGPDVPVAVETKANKCKPEVAANVQS